MPCFTSSSEDETEDDLSSGDDNNIDLEDINESDLDTDFEADELLVNLKQIIQNNSARRVKPSVRAKEAAESSTTIMANRDLMAMEAEEKQQQLTAAKTPSLKLKIKLPPPPPSPQPTAAPAVQDPPPQIRARMINTSLTAKRGKGVVKRGGAHNVNSEPRKKKRKKFSVSSTPYDPMFRQQHQQQQQQQHMSKKMRESLALNQPESDSSDEEDDDNDEEQELDAGENAVALSVPTTTTNSRLYCICQSPHDDVSEMIGCDAPDCPVEWFHFECVGIMVPPEGQWYCNACSKRYNVY